MKTHSTLTLFQRQVINVLLALRRPNVGFHTWAMQALEQTNTKTCHVSMVAHHLFQLIRNRMPQNMSFETWTSKPTTHWNMSSFSGRLNMHFDAHATQAPETYRLQNISPLKHEHFGSYVLTPCAHLMFPHAIPIHASWPIHEALDLFQFSHTLFNFRQTTLSKQLMKAME
jgi:hypothetical protein